MSGYPRPRGVAPRRLVELSDVLPTDPAAVRAALPADVAVTGITHASSDVRPGDLYAALPGANRHGAEFAAAAAAAGAVALLTDARGVALLTDARGAGLAAGAGLPTLVVADPRAALGPLASAVYGDPTERLPLIGITGTAGKTSTAYLVESGLRAAGHRTCLIGTVETRVGDTVVDSVRTTPEATDLHALFAAALEDGVTAGVMEVSSHALAYGRVGGVRFAVGGWTNFGSDHLDFHRDLDDYFAAKATLFDGRCRAEVLNLDDEAVRRLVRATTVTYSAAGDPAATWRAADVRPDRYGQRFTALGPGGLAVDAGVGLPGLHNVANALLAIASLVELGVDPVVAAKGVAACPGVPGRLERVDAPGPVTGVVDYAHKPGAIVAALAALRASLPEGGRLICVIGAGGDRDKGKRPVMGAAAAEGADLVIVTDDNPRTEDPAAIRAQVLAGAITHAAAAEVPGRRAAIDQAVRLARPGDIIALLGKGHERGQEINGEVHPFDDRTVLAEALAARFAGATA